MAGTAVGHSRPRPFPPEPLTALLGAESYTAMSLQLTPESQQQAIASIERYFREHMDEPIGNVAAGGLLKFFLQEIAPVAYNQGVADAQERLQQRVAEIDIEVHHAPFTYWPQPARTRRS